jgi:TonB family protein
MPNPTDKGYFVELNHFSILLARSSSLQSPFAIEDIREVPLDNKAGLEEAVQAVFPETKNGTANVFAALRPKQHGFYLSSADEGKKFATLEALSGVLTEPALASLSPCEYTAVYARDGLPLSGQGAPWLLAATAKESYAKALAILQELKLVPMHISPATLSAAGGLASALKLKGDGSTALLFEFGESSTHLLLVSGDGVEAVRPTPVTMDKVSEAVQAELGLKFKGTAAKLFFNESYDFSESGAKIAARVAKELTADIGALGRTPAAFACTGLPAKQIWFANHLAGALNLAPFAPDLKSWSAQAHLTFPGSAHESSLTPAWLGFLHLIASYQAASPEKSAWQPDWTRTTPRPAVAAPVPAPVFAPPKPAPSSVIAPAKPAAAVPPPASAKTNPPLFTPKPATIAPAKATVITPPKSAATVPPAAPAKPAQPLFTPTPPKSATSSTTPALPIKPAATAPAKPAATAPAKPPAAAPAKPIAAPPPRPIAAPPPRPIVGTPPPKPVIATPPPKPAAAPTPAKPVAEPTPTKTAAAPTPAKLVTAPVSKSVAPPLTKRPQAAPTLFAAKPGFFKSPVGMMAIAAAVLVLGVFGYVGYKHYEKAVAKELRIKAEAERLAQIADAKAAAEKAAKAQAEMFKKAQAEAAARLAAAEAETKAAEEKARLEEAAHLAAARGQINITTLPIGATIAVDDLPARTSPSLFASLKLGHHAVTITLPNYEPAKLDLEVKENETTDPGLIKLIPETGSLELTSDPPGVNYSVHPASNTSSPQGFTTTTVFDESWTNGTRSIQNPPNSLAWYCSSVASSVAVLNGSITLSTGGTSARHLVAYFPRQKLNAGDKLTLTFQCSLAGPFQTIGTATPSSLKVGLFDSNGSLIYDDDNQQSGNPVTYVGYAVGTGFSLPDETSPSLLNIRKRNNSKGNLITSNAGIFRQLPSPQPEAQPWQPETAYTGTVSIEIISSTQAKISADYSGQGLTGYSTTALDNPTGSNSIVSSFDTVAFALPSAGGQTAARALTLSNVKLTCTTPGGSIVGTTPAKLGDLPSGDYVVTFERQGFQSHSETVTVSHDAPAQVAWKFPNGVVLITSTPSGANVTTSDGKALGVTPLTINDVVPSNATYYVVSLDGYDPVTLSCKIEGGKTNTFNATLLSVNRLAKLSELDAQPEAIEQPQPQLSSRIYESGSIEIALTVDRSGNPKDIEVVKNTTNSTEIARLCLAAVAKWKFKPGMIDDKPVNVRVTVPFTISPL